MSEEQIVSLREACARIESKLDHIWKEIARLERGYEEHTKRLSDLERGNDKQKSLNVRIQSHLDTDIPYEVREGQIAKAIAKYVVVALSGAFLSQILPRLFG